MPSDPSSSSTTTTTASPIPCPLPPPIEQCKYSFEMDHAMFGTSRDQWTSPSPYRSFYDDPLSSPSSLLGTGQKGEGHSSSSSSVSTTPSVEPSWNQNNQGSMNQFPNMGNNGMMMNSGQNSSTIMNTNNNNNNTNGNIASNNTTNYNTNPMMMMSTYNNMNSSSSTLPTTNSLNSFSDNNSNNYNNGSIFSANNHLMNIGNTMNQMMMMQNNYAIGMPSSMFNNSSFYTPNNNNLNNLNTFNSFYNLNNGTSNFGNFNPLLASQPPPLSTNNTRTSFSNMPSLKPIPYENGSIIDPEMEDEIFELPSQWSGVLQHYSSAAEWIVSEEFNHSMMEEENLEMILKIMKWYDESQLKLRNGERAQWAVKTLDASSEYSTQWGAVNIAGPSRVYPKYGDFSDAWAPRLQQNSKEFFIVEFSDYYKITGIQIYETFNPGAVTKITCLPRGKDRYTSRKPQLDGSIIGTTTFEARPEDWIVLYEGPTQQHSIGQHSRIFSPSLTNTGVESKVIYVEMDTTNSASWSEVDAVKLIGMPVL